MGHLELKKIIKIFLSKNSYVLYNVKKWQRRKMEKKMQKNEKSRKTRV
jgi:hypothetical protein